MPVRRLVIFCEGQTEETFCNLVIEPHFRALGVWDVQPLLLPSKAGSTERRHKGGWNSYAAARRFMRQVMLEQRNATTLFTSLFDLYAVPLDCPGLQDAPRAPARQRCEHLEAAMQADLGDAGGGRFIARLQLHEFEALLLSDLEAVQRAFPDNASAARDLRADIGTLAPEEVNESPQTAPSKRLIRYIPQYKGLKASAGPLIASDIGLQALRARCPHFDAWLAGLEERCAQ